MSWVQPFSAAQVIQDHLEKTMEKHKVVPIVSNGHLSLDRQLRQQERLTEMYRKDAQILGATETANCLSLAIAATEDARDALAKHHYSQEAKKA